MNDSLCILYLFISIDTYLLSKYTLKITLSYFLLYFKDNVEWFLQLCIKMTSRWKSLYIFIANNRDIRNLLNSTLQFITFKMYLYEFHLSILVIVKVSKIDHENSYNVFIIFLISRQNHNNVFDHCCYFYSNVD